VTLENFKLKMLTWIQFYFSFFNVNLDCVWGADDNEWSLMHDGAIFKLQLRTMAIKMMSAASTHDTIMAEQTWHYLLHWLSLMCRAAWGSAHIVRFVPCCGHAIINYIFEFTFHINYTSPSEHEGGSWNTHTPLSLSQSLSLFFGAQRGRGQIAACEWVSGHRVDPDRVHYMLCRWFDDSFDTRLCIPFQCPMQLSNLFTRQSHFNDV